MVVAPHQLVFHALILIANRVNMKVPLLGQLLALNVLLVICTLLQLQVVWNKVMALKTFVLYGQTPVHVHCVVMVMFLTLRKCFVSLVTYIHKDIHLIVSI